MTDLSGTGNINNWEANTEGEETARFMQRVYGWMAVALVISGATAFYVSGDYTLIKAIFEN